jgi:hypothetical protein
MLVSASGVHPHMYFHVHMAHVAHVGHMALKLLGMPYQQLPAVASEHG